MRDADTSRARPAWLVSAPARVAATTPNAANREIIAATPARTPAWEPAATLTHKIQTATTRRKRIDKAYGERRSGPAARTGTDGMANTNAMLANRSLYSRPNAYNSRYRRPTSSGCPTPA